MIGLLDPRLWLALVLVAAVSFFGGEWHEQRVSTARMDLADGLAKAALREATGRAKTAEMLLAGTHSTIDAERIKEKEDAKTTIDALRADVQRGTVSLSIATRAIRAAPAGQDPGTRYVETRAELVPQAAIDLIDIAADGDNAVRDLNACIDKYDAVRRTLNP
ncbi:lysis system i-spanin subunit Rz [Massilia sp. TSP1-1-2]|uniref:lysis system i-spanin subunit Rz n=1 Tax=Massilia sp. TSP1-1-2 TaxID=2804649 RepID=UPI003CF1A72B